MLVALLSLLSLLLWQKYNFYIRDLINLRGGELSAACWLVAAAGLIVTPTPYGMLLQTQHLPYCHHPHAKLVLIVLMMEMMWIATPSHSAAPILCSPPTQTMRLHVRSPHTCARLVCNEFNHRHTHKHIYKCIHSCK